MPVEPLLAALVGTWRGTGTGEFPGMGTFPFVEEIRFVDVGTRDVVYVQRAWDPATGETLHAEVGVWRCTPEGVLAASVAQPRTAEVSEGMIAAGLVDLASTSVGRAEGSSGLTKTRRRYWFTETDMRYEFEMATERVPDAARHLSATLHRVEDRD